MSRVTYFEGDITSLVHHGAVNTLKTIDLSNSQLEECNDIPFNQLISLTNLNLSYNNIKYLIADFQTNVFVINISHNRLEEVDLNNFVALRELYCSHNRIKRIPFMQMTNSLKIVDLSHNAISDISRLHKFLPAKISSLNISFNKISSLRDFKSLTSFKYLNEIDVLNNPCFDPLIDDYDIIPFLLFLSPRLKKVAGEIINVHQKEIAQQLFTTGGELDPRILEVFSSPTDANLIAYLRSVLERISPVVNTSNIVIDSSQIDQIRFQMDELDSALKFDLKEKDRLLVDLSNRLIDLEAQLKLNNNLMMHDQQSDVKPVLQQINRYINYGNNENSQFLKKKTIDIFTLDDVTLKGFLHSVVQLQAHYRGYSTRLWAKPILNSKKSSEIILQRFQNFEKIFQYHHSLFQTIENNNSKILMHPIIKIQSLCRGFLIRNQTKHLLGKMKEHRHNMIAAAIIIQRSWKKYQRTKLMQSTDNNLLAYISTLEKRIKLLEMKESIVNV
eukprot:TRINITY_DN1352_c0_g1_i1.p1 TRINITY_DN1352_c0_g1~~TRINITY_DN1352_c0_g1_i1.p1  ORF type:complete len:501 (+),score=126.51 TRINITY_DN1352_c0_g1_i1:34-1536(+)